MSVLCIAPICLGCRHYLMSCQQMTFHFKAASPGPSWLQPRTATKQPQCGGLSCCGGAPRGLELEGGHGVGASPLVSRAARRQMCADEGEAMVRDKKALHRAIHRRSDPPTARSTYGAIHLRSATCAARLPTSISMFWKATVVPAATFSSVPNGLGLRLTNEMLLGHLQGT